MKIGEKELRQIIRESIIKYVEQSNINEDFAGLSAHNFIKNGHFRTSSRSQNPVIQAAYKNGWELSKEDENVIEGEYTAKIMQGVFSNVDTDRAPEEVKNPKVSWPMLIALLNKEFRGQGYEVAGSNYRVGFEDLMGNEHSDPYGGGAKRYYGTITVRKIG